MKKSIRRNVYETNSSSTHSICVTRNDILDQHQNHVRFEEGDFGWECSTLNTVSEKASYLYTALSYCSDEESYLDKIETILSNNGIQCEFADGYEGYIDHGGELYDFLEDICNDEDRLMRFLFCSESFIITGNDNDDEGVDIDVSYKHEEFYKGN